MAKNQSRTPGRDVRGGKGRGRAQASRPGGPKGKGARRAAGLARFRAPRIAVRSLATGETSSRAVVPSRRRSGAACR